MQANLYTDLYSNIISRAFAVDNYQSTKPWITTKFPKTIISISQELQYVSYWKPFS